VFNGPVKRVEGTTVKSVQPTTNLPDKKIPRPRRLQSLSFNRMIPNILTLMALSAGLTAIRFAIQERWEYAVLAIFAAAILDTLDGRVARLLKGASKFGAELDSLSDFACFGVAPAMMLYLWAMQDTGKLSWILVLLFTMCMGLRLARFNVARESANAPTWETNFFSGVPAPAGAGLVLLPMVLSFLVGDEYLRTPWVAAGFLFVIGGFLVSAIPTYSFKRLVIPRKRVMPTLLSVAALAAFAVSIPWVTLTGILLLYFGTIPFSVWAHHRYKSGGTEPEIDDEDELGFE